jgi:uncharacterized protein YkwD
MTIGQSNSNEPCDAPTHSPNQTQTSDTRFGPRLRAGATALVLSLVLASCSSAEDALETPDSLAMVDESSTTVADEAGTTTSPPAETEPETSDPTATDAPTTVPMTAPAGTDPAAPAPDATDPQATNPPATDPPATDAPADPLAGADALTQAEAESFRLLNQLRASLGLSQLARNAKMDSFARNWSQTMATSGNFEHSGGPYGENIAWNSQESLAPTDAAAAMHEMWINSPGHYANMTSADYTLAGIGFYQDGSGWHSTHVFER